jgi:uncharacterized protein YbjT (DUF2867 family)
MLVIAGASGKLGFATLTSLLEHDLIPASEITVTSSSASGAAKLKPATEKGAKLVSAEWDDPASWEAAFEDADKLFLISSARIEKDFGDAPYGQGREADHFRALEAAKKAGVKHVYYTSLAFANPSKSRVMKAHERTEEYLRNEWPGKFTIIREGLYNESWPLYFGHYDVPNDDRDEVITAGDSLISWTSIPDLGLANALILAAPSGDWAGKTFYLSQRKAHTLNEVAGMVSKARGKTVGFRVVPREEHEKFYVEKHMPEPMITWWSKSYDALRDGECQIDDPTLERLLAEKGVKPTPMEETVANMLST